MEMAVFFLIIYLLERGNHVQNKKNNNKTTQLIAYIIQRKSICSITAQQTLRHLFFSMEVTMLLIQRQKN